MSKISILAKQSLQPGSGHRIPNPAYYDMAWQEKENTDLFEKVWKFAGVVLDVPNPGDYLTVKIGRAPVLIVRDRENKIRAFHNFCRHRGAQLLDGQGHCSTISCPYHAWNYGLDGQLRKVPHHEEQFASMKLEDWPLLPVSCDVHAGMIFVNVNPAPMPLAEWLGDLGGYLSRYDIGNLFEIQRVQYPLKSNWKYFAENHIDWLHLFYLHAKTLNMFDHEKGYWQQSGDHWMSFEVAEPTKEGEIAERKDGMLPIPDLETEGSYGAHLIFPNLPVTTSDSSFTTMELIPDGPTRSTLEVRTFAHPGSTLPESRKAENNKVMEEDQLAAERMQLTIESPFTEVGPLALEYESPIVDFHATYLKYVNQP